MKSKAYLCDDEADAIMAAARDAAAEATVPLCIALVDDGANLLRFVRLDGAALMSVEVSIAKAATAAKLRTATADLAAMAAQSASILALPGIVPFAGGVPLLRDSVLVGAIGVSGGTLEEDQRVATKGLSALG